MPVPVANAQAIQTAAGLNGSANGVNPGLSNYLANQQTIRNNIFAQKADPNSNFNQTAAQANQILQSKGLPITQAGDTSSLYQANGQPISTAQQFAQSPFLSGQLANVPINPNSQYGQAFPQQTATFNQQFPAGYSYNPATGMGTAPGSSQFNNPTSIAGLGQQAAAWGGNGPAGSITPQQAASASQSAQPYYQSPAFQQQIQQELNQFQNPLNNPPPTQSGATQQTQQGPPQQSSTGMSTGQGLDPYGSFSNFLAGLKARGATF